MCQGNAHGQESTFRGARSLAGLFSIKLFAAANAPFLQTVRCKRVTPHPTRCRLLGSFARAANFYGAPRASAPKPQNPPQKFLHCHNGDPARQVVACAA